MPESVQGPFMIIMTFNLPQTWWGWPSNAHFTNDEISGFWDLFGVLSTGVRVQNKLMLSAPCIEAQG